MIIPSNIGEDLQKIREYNKSLLNIDVQSSLFNVDELSGSLQTYIKNLDKGKASATGYIASLFSINKANIAARLSTLALNAAVAAFSTIILNLAIAGIIKLITHEKELIERTKQATEEFNSQKQSLEDYASQYEDLHTALLKANGDEEETKRIKQELLNLQKTLNEEYGEAYGKVNLLADSYEAATEKLKEYNEELANQYYNENKEGLEKNNEKMSKETNYSLGTYVPRYSEAGTEIYNIAKQFEDQGIQINEDGEGFLSISIKEDATNAYEIINDFMTEVGKLEPKFDEDPILSDFLNSTSSALNDAKKIIDENAEGDLNYLNHLINVNDDETLETLRDNATNAAETFNEAFAESADPYNDETLKAYREGLKRLEQEFLNLSVADQEKYSRVFEPIFSNDNIKSYDFNQELQNNLRGSVDNLSGLTQEDILAIDDALSEAQENMENLTPDQKQIVTSWENIRRAAEKYGIGVEEAVSAVSKFNQTDIKQNNQEIIESFSSKSEAISQITSLSEGFEELDKIYESISDKDPFDFKLLDDDKFKENFEGLGSSYENFIETVSDSPDDINACQEAFDTLITDWIDSTGILDKVTDETAGLTAAMLENMGVANAEEVVNEVLREKKNALAAANEYLKETGQDLSNATLDEIYAFLELSNISEQTRQQIAAYAIQKELANGATIDTSGDCANLARLVGYLGATNDALIAYNQVKAGATTKVLGVSGRDVKFIQEQAQKELDTAIKDFDMKANSINYVGGNKSNSGGGGRDKKSKEPTVFDWMEQKIENLNDQIDKLKDNIDILVGYKAKNITTDTALDLMAQKLETLQQMYDRYMQQANSVGLSEDYISKIQSGAMDIESIGDEKLVDLIQEYQKWYDKAQEMSDNITQTKKDIKELNLSKLDNIIDQYEQVIDIQDRILDTQEQMIDLQEQSGEKIQVNDYMSLAQQQYKIAQQNKEAFDALAFEMNNIDLEEGSEEWKKYNDQLEDYKNNIISATQAVEDYKDSIVELIYKDLDDFKNKMDSINDSISSMSNLIGDSGLIDDFGNLTDRGLAQVALYAQQLANAKQEASEYAEAIDSLDDALNSGLITQDEYTEMLYDYKSAQENAVQASKDAKDAILDLVKQGIQAEIDAMKERIDLLKEELQAEQDLHDYQNSITEKQDNISKLQRQIAALSNSTSREDLAQRLQLESELAEAQKDLYETQYDHEMQERQDALDEQYEAYEKEKQEEMEELDTNLDKQEAAIKDYLDQVKNNYSSVYDILNQYGDEYNLSATEDLTKPWDSGRDAANMCADAIGEAIANINYEISNIDISPLYALIDALNSLGYGMGDGYSGYYEDISNSGKWQQGQGGKWWFGEEYNPNGDYYYASDGVYTINGKQYKFDENGYLVTGWQQNDSGDWNYFETDNDNGEMVKSSWRQGQDGNWYYLDKNGIMATNMAIKEEDGDGYYYVNEEGVWDGEKLTEEEIKKLKLKVGYKLGTKNARKGLNLMDEEGTGSEVIVTKYGTLKQFEGGETVFNKEMTKKLWDFAKNPNNFIDKMNMGSKIDLSKLKPISSFVEFNAPLFQISGGLSSDMVGYINEKCEWLQKNVGKLAYKDLKGTLLGK